MRYALLDAGEIKRIRLAGMKPDRAEVLAGGVAVLSAVFESLEIDEMRPARGALRVGVLYDLLGRRERKDLRDSTVVRMQGRLASTARRRNASARSPHSFILPQHGGERRDGEPAALGSSAARGRVCDFAQRLPQALGVSDSAQRHCWLFDIGPGTRRDPGSRAAGNEKVYQALEDHEGAASILSLRLAVILAHARRAVELPNWSVKFGKTIELGLASDWLTRHPLTQYLLEEEATHWERWVSPSRCVLCSRVYTKSGLITARNTVFSSPLFSRWLNHHSPPFFSDQSSA